MRRQKNEMKITNAPHPTHSSRSMCAAERCMKNKKFRTFASYNELVKYLLTYLLTYLVLTCIVSLKELGAIIEEFTTNTETSTPSPPSSLSPATMHSKRFYPD